MIKFKTIHYPENDLGKLKMRLDKEKQVMTTNEIQFRFLFTKLLVLITSCNVVFV